MSSMANVWATLSAPSCSGPLPSRPRDEPGRDPTNADILDGAHGWVGSCHVQLRISTQDLADATSVSPSQAHSKPRKRHITPA